MWWLKEKDIAKTPDIIYNAMKQNKMICFSIFLLLFIGCRSRQIIFPPMVISEYQLTDFCDLPKNINELVYTSAIYSGVDEYWSLTSAKCKELSSALEIPNDVIMDVKFKKLFEYVHKKYWNSYLIIDAIGRFESDNKAGYGHLGSNNSKFVVKRIINIQFVEKK